MKNKNKVPDSDSAITRETSNSAPLKNIELDEDALRNKTDILSNLIVNLQEGILLEDSNRKIVLTNQLFCDMFGIPAPPEALVGADCSDSAEQSKIFFKNPDKFIAGISIVLSEKKPVFNDELELVDGRHFQRDYIPTWLNNEYSGHLWKYRDVTDRKVAENGLRKLSRAVEQSPVLIYITNLAGLIEYVNPKTHEVTGYTKEELLGQNPRIFSSGEKPKEEYKNLWNAISSGEEWKGEFHNKKKGGEFYWVMASISPVSDANGNITHYVAVEEDITVRKQAEREIHDLNVNLEHKIAERTAQLADAYENLQQKNEERISALAAMEEALDRLHKIADQVPGVVYQFRLRPDGTSCFPFASEGIQDIYRVSPEEVADDASIVFSRLHPDDLDGVAASINESAKNLTHWQLEYRVKFEDGTVRWLAGNALPQREPDGSVLWHGFITDITERKRVENQLLQVSTRLALATRAGGVGVWDLDIVNNILVWDPQMFALYGINQEDFSGAYEVWQAGLHPDDMVRGDEEIQSAILGEKEFNTEFRVVWPDGTIRNIRAMAVVMRDDAGNPLHMIGTNWDITTQKQTEEYLKKARNEAEKANLAKSDFLSRMSHELRTPMNSILGFAQLMNMIESEPAKKNSINHILNSGKHLLNLINEVLDISGIEAGRSSLSMEPVKLTDILTEVLDMVQPLASSQQVTLELVNSPDNLLFVKADRQRMKQVLLNLLNNAVKYTRECGFVRMKTEYHESDARDCAKIRISITDNGLGISEDDIPKLFHPFERIGAEKTKTEGTGLGLTVVKKLMDAMGGSVGVDSVPGEGSTFWIEIQHSDDPKIQAKQTEFECNQGTMVNEITGTIFSIEDNPSNIELIEQILHQHRPGIRLVSVLHGREAVSMAIEYTPDLILLDLDLPDIQGFEVISLLLANENTKAIPVVVISADAVLRHIEKLMDAGAKEYMTKPLDIIEFLQVVDRWITPKTRNNQKQTDL